MKTFLVILGIIAFAIFSVYRYISQEPGYIIKGNKVYYAYWGFNDWKYHKFQLENADAKTFQIIGVPHSFYARDAKRVYFKGNPLEKADPETFVVGNRQKTPFDYDAHNLYLGRKLISEDVHNYRGLGNNYSKDSKRVYYLYEPIEGADPETFAVIKEMLGSYARDKNHIYLNKQPIRGADGATFQKLGGSYWKDKSSIYNNNTKIEKADFSTFQHLGGLYARDRDHVYYQSKIIPEANPARIKVIKSKVGNVLYLEDGQHKYEGIEKVASDHQ